MCAVLGGELDAKSITIERSREGDDPVVIKCMDVWGDDSDNPCRGLRKTAKTARVAFG